MTNILQCSELPPSRPEHNPAPFAVGLHGTDTGSAWEIIKNGFNSEAYFARLDAQHQHIILGNTERKS